MASETQFPESFKLAQPARPEAISQTEQQLGYALPRAYREFLETSDGGSGTIGGKYLVLWPAADLVPTFLAYDMDDDQRPLLMFASDGAAMVAAFDLRRENQVVVAPLDGLDLPTTVADTFEEFVAALSHGSLGALWQREPTRR